MILLYLVSALAYAAWQWYVLRAWQRLPPPPAGAQPLPGPFLSVLLPVRNEQDYLQDCLRDLLAQDYPADRYEIILIDDHSTDNSPAIAARFSDPRLRTYRLSGLLDGQPVTAYKKEALSRGVGLARGQWIVTTDADCRLPAGWLSGIARQTGNGAGMVLGPVICHPARGLLGRLQALDLAGYMLLTGAAVQGGFPLLANGANLAFEKDLFRQVGGYHGLTHLPSGDDVLLLQKVAAAAPQRIVFSRTDAAVRTAPVADWAAFWRQRLRWASKTGAYRDRRLTLLQGSIWVFCTAILLGLFTGYWPAALAAWSVKAGADFIYLRRAARFFRHPEWMRHYLPAQFIHTLYISTVGLAALLGLRPAWKGRP